jgi:hypothetical protein
MPQLPHPLLYHDRDRRPATNHARSGTTVRTEGSARLHREREDSRTRDARPSSPRAGGGHGSRGPAQDPYPVSLFSPASRRGGSHCPDRTRGRKIGSLPDAEISPDQDLSTGTEQLPRLQEPKRAAPQERPLARRWLAPRRREVAFGRQSIDGTYAEPNDESDHAPTRNWPRRAGESEASAAPVPAVLPCRVGGRRPETVRLSRLVSGLPPAAASNRVEARLALAPPTPPGMRVRTGRFAQHSRKRR